MTEEERLLKNKQISISKQETLKKRQNQVCKTFTVKVSKNHLSKLQKEQLKMIFVEAKWIYNDMINWSSKEDNKIWNYDSKIKKIVHKNKNFENVESELKYIGSSMKQWIVQNAVSNIKTLSTLKKKGNKVGKLKFKKEINCIGLKQNGITHKIISKNRMKIQGISGSLFINGLKQINENCEISSAKLLNKPDGYYIAITTFSDKKVDKYKENSIGIDFGCSTSFTTSEGKKINVKIQESERLKKLQRKLSKQKKNSKNFNKTKNLLKIEYQKISNKKNDVANKVVHEFAQHNLVVIQDEQLRNWQKNGHGKAIQHSILGRVKTKLTNKRNVCIISKWKPTTKLCMNCGEIHDEMKLSDRIFKCSCGIEMDRDIHAAQNILKFGLEKIGTDSIEFTPVDIKALLDELFNSESNLGG
jgi:putative transposase